MKSLGGLKYFLGIEVAQSKRGIFLSQRKYTLDLLSKVGLLDCKPTDVPIQQNHRLGEYPYQIPTNKVSVVSQFMHYPSEDHMNAVTQILRYLKGTSRKGIMFSKNGHLEITSFPPSYEMNLLCDNKAIIDIAHNLVQHDRTKHVEVDRHVIKQNLEAKIIQFPFVKSEYQLADILTKAVCRRYFTTHLTSWASATSMHQLEEGVDMSCIIPTLQA
ncbi:putative mitochondrial protein [Vitis vinifera]|uniref:Putative mitochondrial protein n=1 Tax=Vitis vinifera TaxID=29760 RepID=A0A438I2Y5_VITVI|nr:putative mitochondrial protein [Vitis vinifera]